MTNRSFYRSSILALVFILVLLVIETVALYLQFNSGNLLDKIVNDSTNIILSFLIIYVIAFISIMIYHPLKMKKSVKKLQHIFDELRGGNYQYDITNANDTIEKEFTPLLESIARVLQNIIKFDKLKEAKIFTQHSRITGLLSLMAEGAFVVDNTGEIIYINKVASSNYKFLAEDINILDTVLNNAFENSVKKYIKKVIDNQMRSEPKNLLNPDTGKEFTIKSVLYKNHSGVIQGAVFVLSGIKEQPSAISNLVKRIK